MLSPGTMMKGVVGNDETVHAVSDSLCAVQVPARERHSVGRSDAGGNGIQRRLLSCDDVDTVSEGGKMDKEIDLKKAWEEHLKRMEKKKKNGETEKHTDEAGAKRPWENLLRVPLVL